ncbi:MAG: IS110 family transposase [Pseudomonadota bacterium]
MELKSIYKCVIGLDVHQAQITVCVINEDENGNVRIVHRQFGTFKRDLRELAQWCASFAADEVVMESTGIYWKSPYAALERAGIYAKVVNARHVKQVPGRKTDINDAQWLAMLGRAGLLRGSFVPKALMRELRLVSRQRQKLVGELASNKNRLHKYLTDAGIRLSVVISDIHGKSARLMIKELIKGSPPEKVIRLATHRFKADHQEILRALEGELTDSHRMVLNLLMEHIEALETRIATLDAYLLERLHDYRGILELLQTIPGVDRIGAAMLLVEIGDNMQVFETADRLASWAGVCPGNNESAGKRKTGRTRKGNPYVRRLLCEFAHAASRTQCAFKNKFQSLLVRRGRKRALIAIAHKMLRTIFFIISRGECYRDNAVDYQEMLVKRNAPRWIRMLKQYGFIAHT